MATLIPYSSHSLSIVSKASSAGSETIVSMPMSLANSNILRLWANPWEAETPVVHQLDAESASFFLTAVRRPAGESSLNVRFG